MKARLGEDVQDGQLLLGGPGEPLSADVAATGSISGGATLSSNPTARSVALTIILTAPGTGGGGYRGGTGAARPSIA